MSPVLKAAFWLSVYVTLVLLPLVVLLIVPIPAGGGFWWELAIGLGYAAAIMMAVQFVLTGRFRRAVEPFGIDLIYYFHRYLAYLLLVMLVAHPVILMVANPALVGYLNPLATPADVNAGTASLVLVLAIVVTSAWRRPLGINYEPWRLAHLVLAVAAVGLAFVHMLSIGHYTGVPVVRGLWVLIGLSLVVVVVRDRLVRPWHMIRSPYRVATVRREQGDTWTLVIEPDGHDGFAFQPGQFAWLTFRGSPFVMREHPFSIASAPAPGGRLEFAIKELGDFTREIGGIEPGERCYVDGPYGSFSVDRRPDAPGYVFIAGGIGVAPMMSMMRALAQRGDSRPHILFAAHSALDRVPLGEELMQLADRLDLRVIHVLEAPPEGWTGEKGLITREILDRHLPANRGDLEYYVCGPVPMIRSVERSLNELRVPNSRVHTELFDLV